MGHILSSIELMKRRFFGLKIHFDLLDPHSLFV